MRQRHIATIPVVQTSSQMGKLHVKKTKLVKTEPQSTLTLCNAPRVIDHKTFFDFVQGHI